LELGATTVGVLMIERGNDSAMIVAAAEEQTDLAQSVRVPVRLRAEVEDILHRSG
jgi:hypothetical protein